MLEVSSRSSILQALLRSDHLNNLIDQSKNETNPKAREE